MFIYKSVTIRGVIKARILDATKRTLHETTSRLLQLRTHADKEIEKLNDDVKKRDSTIKAQMTYIENLHKVVSK